MARTGLAVGGVILVLLGGAALTWGDDDSGFLGDTRTRTTSLRGVESIELDGGSGSVDIRYQRGARPHVEQTEHGWWGGWFGDSEPRHRLTDGELLLDTDCGWNCNVNYVVTLPNAVPVQGRTGSGSLEITGMSAVDVEVGSGSLTLSRIAGPVTAHTGSGSITLDDIDGRIDVESGSGRIEGDDLRARNVHAHTGTGSVALELLNPRSVEVDTGSGRIELTVPGGDPYRVETHTGSGSTDIDVERAPNAERSLRLSTDAGSIDVDRT